VPPTRNRSALTARQTASVREGYRRPPRVPSYRSDMINIVVKSFAESAVESSRRRRRRCRRSRGKRVGERESDRERWSSVAGGERERVRRERERETRSSGMAEEGGKEWEIGQTSRRNVAAGSQSKTLRARPPRRVYVCCRDVAKCVARVRRRCGFGAQVFRLSRTSVVLYTDSVRPSVRPTGVHGRHCVIAIEPRFATVFAAAVPRRRRVAETWLFPPPPSQTRPKSGASETVSRTSSFYRRDAYVSVGT